MLSPFLPAAVLGTGQRPAGFSDRQMREPPKCGGGGGIHLALSSPRETRAVSLGNVHHEGLAIGPDISRVFEQTENGIAVSSVYTGVNRTDRRTQEGNPVTTTVYPPPIRFFNLNRKNVVADFAGGTITGDAGGGSAPRRRPAADRSSLRPDFSFCTSALFPEPCKLIQPQRRRHVFDRAPSHENNLPWRGCAANH